MYTSQMSGYVDLRIIKQIILIQVSHTHTHLPWEDKRSHQRIFVLILGKTRLLCGAHGYGKTAKSQSYCDISILS